MNIDLLTQVTYLPVFNAANISTNVNSSAVLLGGVQTTNGTNNGGYNNAGAGFKGRLALIVTTSAGGGTTPSITGYLQTGPTNNIAAASNVTLTTYSLTANVLATNPLNSNVASFTLGGTAGTSVYGFDTRAVGNYVFLCTNITGTNAPNIVLSAVIVGTKAYEPS